MHRTRYTHADLLAFYWGNWRNKTRREAEMFLVVWRKILLGVFIGVLINSNILLISARGIS